MNDQSDRILCPHCGASNVPSSTTCWQCGRVMHASEDQPGGMPPVTQPASEQRPPQSPDTNIQPPYIPPPVPSAPRTDTQVLIILGYVFAGLGLVPICCAWPFGITAIILGIVAAAKGDTRGIWVIIAGASAFFISVSIGIYAVRHMPDVYQGHKGSWPPMPMPQ